MSKKITGDNDLRIQYQKELNAIHAPKELTESVKLAVKQEQKKRGVSDKGYIKWVSIAAAAVLLVCVIVFGKYISDGNDFKNKSVQLGTEGIKETEYIQMTEDGTKFGELIINVTDKTQDEVLSRETEEITIGGLQVVVSINVISGYYQCFYEEDGQNYLITSKMTEKEAFLEELSEFLDTE